MNEYFSWSDVIPVVLGYVVGILSAMPRSRDFKVLNSKMELVLEHNATHHRDLEKKIDELRLQVGIINHGSRIIHMPQMVADVVERQKPGPKPGSKRKVKEIE